MRCTAGCWLALLATWLRPEGCSGFVEYYTLGESTINGQKPLGVALLASLRPNALFFRQGRNMIRAAEMFLQDLNEWQGGIRLQGSRRAISLTVVDDNGDPSHVNTSVAELMRRGFKFFLGPQGVPLVRAVADEVHAGGGLMMGPCCQDEQPFSGRPTIFSVESPTRMVLPEAFQLLAGVQGAPRTVASWVQSTHPRFADICRHVPDLAARHGMTFLGSVTSDAAVENISASVGKLKAMKPELVIGCTIECESFLTQAEQLDFNTNASLFTFCNNRPGFFNRMKDKGRHILTVAPWEPSLDFSARGWTVPTFAKMFEDVFGDPPNAVSAQAWSALSVMVDAIERADSLDPAAVAEKIRLGTFETIFGTLTFSDGMSTQPWHVFQIQANGTLLRLDVDPAKQEAELFYPQPPWLTRPCRNDDVPKARIGFSNGACGPCPDRQVAVFDAAKQIRTCQPCASSVRFVELPPLSENGYPRAFCQPHCVPGRAGEKCELCPPGQYEEDDRCTDCEVGKFSSMFGATECTLCPQGTFSSIVAASACTLCQKGRNSAVQGALECVTCPKGKNTSKFGSDQCSLCNPGWVSQREGSAECVPCGLGERSLWGARQCEACPARTYQNQIGQDVCTSDSWGQFSQTPGTIDPSNLAGFWSAGGGEIELCRFDPNACLSNGRCREGHTGRQCLECVPGWIRGRGHCFKCPVRWLNISMTVIMAIVAVVMGLLLSRFIISSVNRPQDTILVVLFKQMVNHCVAMSVCHRLFSNMLREANAISDDHIFWAQLIAVPQYVFDGIINTETPLWSLSCLFQVRLPEEETHLLATANQTSYYSDALLAARELMQSTGFASALGMLIFFFSWPVLYIGACNLFGLTLLYAQVNRHKEMYLEAFDFYKDVKEQGYKTVEKKYMERKRREFIDAYYYRINGIWSPVMHVINTQVRNTRARGHGGMISRELYLEESVIIKSVAMFCSYAPTCRNLVRPLLCVSVGSAASSWGTLYMIFSQAGLECGLDKPVIWLSMCLASVWFFVFPAHSYYRLWQVHEHLHLAHFVREFGFITCGYRWDYWWWDPVIFIRKGLCFIVEALPLIQERERIMIMLILSIFFFVLEFSFSPYDDRCNGLFHRLELMQGSIFIVYVMLTMLTLEYTATSAAEVDSLGGGEASEKAAIGGNFVVILSVLMTLVHILYLLKIWGHFFECLLDMVVSKMDHARLPENKYVQWAQKTIVSMHSTKMRDAPYVSFDQLYGWISICGTHGDMAIPPYMPKGEMAKSLNKEGRPLLSEAPLRPDVTVTETPVEIASSSQRCELHRMLTMAVNHITASHESGPAFSLSVFEFVIRVAFSLSKGDKMLADRSEGDTPMEVDRKVWNDAMVAKDPLALKAGEDEQVAGEAGDEEREYVERALLMEEELQKAFSDARLKARDTGQGATGRHDEEEHIPYLVRLIQCCRRQALGCAQTVHLKKKRKKTQHELDMEQEEEGKLLKLKQERYTALVQSMFSPGIFRRGLTLMRMQFAIMQIQSLPRQDIMIWLDLFERQWLHERARSNMELRRMVGLTADKCEESSINAPTKRREKRDPTEKDVGFVVTMNQETQCSAFHTQSLSMMRLGNSVRRTKTSLAATIDEDPDPPLDVAMRWVILMTGLNGSVSIHELLKSRQGHGTKEQTAIRKAIRDVAVLQEQEDAKLSRAMRGEADPNKAMRADLDKEAFDIVSKAKVDISREGTTTSVQSMGKGPVSREGTTASVAPSIPDEMAPGESAKPTVPSTVPPVAMGQNGVVPPKASKATDFGRPADGEAGKARSVDLYV